MDRLRDDTESGHQQEPPTADVGHYARAHAVSSTTLPVPSDGPSVAAEAAYAAGPATPPECGRNLVLVGDGDPGDFYGGEDRQRIQCFSALVGKDPVLLPDPYPPRGISPEMKSDPPVDWPVVGRKTPIPDGKFTGRRGCPRCEEQEKDTCFGGGEEQEYPDNIPAGDGSYADQGGCKHVRLLGQEVPPSPSKSVAKPISGGSSLLGDCDKGGTATQVVKGGDGVLLPSQPSVAGIQGVSEPTEILAYLSASVPTTPTDCNVTQGEKGDGYNARGMAHPRQARTNADSSVLHVPKPAAQNCSRGSSLVADDHGVDGLEAPAAGDRGERSTAKDSGMSSVHVVVSTITVEEGSGKRPVVAGAISPEIPAAAGPSAPTLGVAIELLGAPETGDLDDVSSSSLTGISVVIRDAEGGRENACGSEDGCSGGWAQAERMQLPGTSPGPSQSRERIRKTSDAPAEEAVAGDDRRSAGCFARSPTREAAPSQRGSRTARDDDRDSRPGCRESEATIRNGLSSSAAAALNDGELHRNPVAASDPISGVKSELTQRSRAERDELRGALRMVKEREKVRRRRERALREALEKGKARAVSKARALEEDRNRLREALSRSEADCAALRAKLAPAEVSTTMSDEVRTPGGPRVHLADKEAGNDSEVPDEGHRSQPAAHISGARAALACLEPPPPSSSPCQSRLQSAQAYSSSPTRTRAAFDEKEEGASATAGETLGDDGGALLPGDGRLVDEICTVVTSRADGGRHVDGALVDGCDDSRKYRSPPEHRRRDHVDEVVHPGGNGDTLAVEGEKKRSEGRRRRRKKKQSVGLIAPPSPLGAPTKEAVQARRVIPAVESSLSGQFDQLSRQSSSRSGASYNSTSFEAGLPLEQAGLTDWRWIRLLRRARMVKSGPGACSPLDGDIAECNQGGDEMGQRHLIIEGSRQGAPEGPAAAAAMGVYADADAFLRRGHLKLVAARRLLASSQRGPPTPSSPEAAEDVFDEPRPDHVVIGSSSSSASLLEPESFGRQQVRYSIAARDDDDDDGESSGSGDAMDIEVSRSLRADVAEVRERLAALQRKVRSEET